MANCNDLFQKFLKKITFTDSNGDLKKGKDAIRNKIKKYFSDELEVKQPEFFLQGSYSLKTMVIPVNLIDEYDLDDGIYLQHLGNNRNDWPVSQTVSNWIVNALKEHTKKKPENKKNCVRVVYADSYHIDLPVYCESNGSIYLARLGDNQWVPSDAKAFNKWFYDRLEKTEQMRSCIKYLKAWKDFRGCDLKGIHITVLVGLNHAAVKNRDDKSLTETVGRIIEYLDDKKAIYNPIDGEEDLIEDWSVGKRAAAIDDLRKLHEKSLKAIEATDKQEASKVWRQVLGDRFPRNDGEKRDGVIVGLSHREFESRTKPWRGI